jgi:putative inorganic carbon (HCO3(-)) transporter
MESLPLWAGTLLCACAAGAGLLPVAAKLRLAGLSLAMVLAPVLIAADNWQSDRLVELRDSPELLGAAAVVALLALAALAFVFMRRAWLIVPVALAVVPFRIPVDLAGSTANLLLPLYAVLAAALIAAWAVEGRAGGGGVERRSAGAAGGPIGPLLALVVVLYAAQAAYAGDASAAVENVCFFFAPFATLFFLLGRVEWEPRLLRTVITIVAVEALVVVAIGFGQYATGELFWNDKVIAGNEAHAWFRVNSIFYDPNIMGRFLAVAMVLLAAVATWSRVRREALGAAAVFVVLLAGLAITFSQSSLLGLIGGLLVLALARWGLARALAAAAAVAVCLALSVTAVDAGGLEAETSGRDGLISGGLEIAEDRPLHGYGSGSFAAEFEDRFGAEDGNAVASHAEPVTIAVEQGALGLLPYLALIAATVWVLLAKAGMTLRGARDPVAAAVLAAFAAMIVHSLGYAAFLIDPITWALLGVAAAVPGRPRPAD